MSRQQNGAGIQVYSAIARDVVRIVTTGGSGAVLMYGATGSGKTWTMTGGPGDPGIVQRAITDLFMELPTEQTTAVNMSVLEVYNEVSICPEKCHRQVKHLRKFEPQVRAMMSESTGAGQPIKKWLLIP